MPKHYSVLEPWVHKNIYRPALASTAARLDAWQWRRSPGSRSVESVMRYMRRALRNKTAGEIKSVLARNRRDGSRRVTFKPDRLRENRDELELQRLRLQYRRSPAHHSPKGAHPLPTMEQRLADHVASLLGDTSTMAPDVGGSETLLHALDLAVPLSRTLCMAWDTLSMAEQAEAQREGAGTPLGHRAWEAVGVFRLRGRREAALGESTVVDSLLVMDASMRAARDQRHMREMTATPTIGVPASSVSSTGTIPGSGGDVPGVPDAWCSLYRVHRFRERTEPPDAAGIREELFGESPSAHAPDVEHDPAQHSERPCADDPRGPASVPDGKPSESDTGRPRDTPLGESSQCPDSMEETADPRDMTQGLAAGRDVSADFHALDSHPLGAGDGEDDDDTDSGGADFTPEALLCSKIGTDGSVRWHYGEQLSAVRDEQGTLLLVFYAYMRGHRVKVLVDSGASDNFVSEDCARRCSLRVRHGPTMRVTLADGSVKTTGAVAYSKFTADTSVGTYSEPAMAMRVLSLGIQVDVVLGGKWLRSLSPVELDYDGHGSVSFARRTKGGGTGRVTIAGCNPGKSGSGGGKRGSECAGLVDEIFLSSAQLRKHLTHAETLRQQGETSGLPTWLMMARREQGTEGSAFAATAADLSGDVDAAEAGTTPDAPQDTKDAEAPPCWRQRFAALFDEFEKELRDALPPQDQLRQTEDDKARVNLKPDKEGGPPFRRPYRMSVEELRQMRERIEQLMEKGYIRPSSSPYAAPCLMVPKPGQPHVLRLVVDYRQLNAQTIRDRYPLPDIQLMFDEMHGATHFSSFDAVDGFWQVPMAEEDVEKTAFTTQMGAYEWLVMPQGLQNSPSQYQRRMQRALGHLPFVRIFIDDVVVFTTGGIEEHYRCVREFLLTCREKGVYLKKSKAQMLKQSLRFLGHTLSSEGCQPQQDKVAAVRDWPVLQNATHVRQFLGLAGYYRRFIHCFSDIAQPLTMLTKTDVEWRWGPEQQWSFDELKAALVKAPVLALPDMKAAADGSAPFVVQTDASGVALGGVLMQDCGGGLRVIAYDSRQFTAAEQNYHTGERELGAIHHCTTVTWRHYLIFTEFKLQGDHRPLEWLMEPGRELSRRQARWYMDLVEVGVPRMEYVKGALLLVPDALSRRPDYAAKTPREGLKEAGVLDGKSDLPKDPLSVLDSSDLFEQGPALGQAHRLAEVESWLDAVDTLQAAEHAMEQATLAYQVAIPPAPLRHLKAAGRTGLRERQRKTQAATPGGEAVAEVGPTQRLPAAAKVRPEDPAKVVGPEIGVAGRTRSRTGQKTRAADTHDGDVVAEAGPTTRRAPVVRAEPGNPAEVVTSEVGSRADLREGEPRIGIRLQKMVFDKLQAKYGQFDVDACGPPGGNRLVAKSWRDCLKEKWRGLHVWCSPPCSDDHLSIEAVLHTYVQEWRLDPENTSAVFLLPDVQARLRHWRGLFRKAGMRIEEVIPTHDAHGDPTQLFEDVHGRPCSSPWPMLVVYAPPSRSRPQRIKKTRVPQPIVREGAAAELRDAVTGASDAEFLKALRAEYERDGPLRTLREKVLSAPHGTTKDFRVVGDVLWRVSAGRYQLVLGEDSPLREVVIRGAHDSLGAGHTGRDKTLERVLRRFWWRYASDDVGAWVTSCPVCQAVKPRSSYPDGLLNPHTVPSRNWQVVGLDFVTGLPLTEQGNDAFVAFTCKLSKMVHVVPLNFGDSSAKTIARIYFDTVWRQHGAPMKLVSDRDPRFQDAFWQELMRLMGVKVAMTTPYNPRSDGQAEHTNRVIEDMLRSFVDANPMDWDLYTTNVEFAINDSRSDVTGFTPFELCYGVSPMSQLDMFVEAAQSTGGRRKGGEGTAHEWAFRFSSQLRDARSRLELAQQRQRDHFDQRHGQREYAVGDLVWIEAKHLTEKVMDRSLCRKLSKRWHGPVPVTERFYSDMQASVPEADRGAPVAYRLRLPPHWRIHDVFAQHRLKPYVGGADAFASRERPAAPEAVVVDGQREAHVEKILARRVRISRGKEIEEWKVRWTGYSKAHDQWRTRDKLERGAPLQQLREFETKRLAMEDQVRDSAMRRREHLRGSADLGTVVTGVSLAQMVAQPWEERLGRKTPDACLPWERYEESADGEDMYVTELADSSQRPVRLLVLFSGTGSVETAFAKCFPTSTVVTLDSDPGWRPTHVESIEQWDYWRYPPGYFDVVWASPPCTQYSQARTTGGPPDLVTADACVQRTLDIIEYLRPLHWFMENPKGRHPNALRFRPVMRHLPAPLMCTYCMYGERYKKPTCIWTSSPPPRELQQCTAITPCACRWATGVHPITAQLGPHPQQKGMRKSHAVYPIPSLLLQQLFQHLTFENVHEKTEGLP